MKNLKKVLSLVLALAMALSLMTVAFAKEASDYTDYDTVTNKEAVSVLTALNVIDGMGNNTFQPTGNVTRAQMAKMITIISLGNVDATAFLGTQTDLKDINGHWGEAYIKYCYSQGIISGRGNGVFDPNANVTAAEASKMLLTAIGYNSDVQGYTGAQWAINVTRDAQLKGFYKDVSVPSNKALTRDEAAQMIWNAVQAQTVRQSKSLNTETGVVTISYVDETYTAAGGAVRAESLLHKTFNAVSETSYMDGATYDSTKKTFTYSFSDTAYGQEDTDSAIRPTLTTATDYSNLFGQKVTAVYKNDANEKYPVYGIYAEGEVVATGTLGQITDTDGNALGSTDTDTKIKIDSTEYKLAKPAYDADAADRVNLVIYNGNAYSLSGALNNRTYTEDYHTFSAIDNNDDGKIDVIVSQPYTVAEVTYVGTTSITAGNSYTYDKDTGLYSYNGQSYTFPKVAKGDFVLIPSAGVGNDAAWAVKNVEIVEGKVTGESATKAQVNGTWYVKNGNTAALNNTYKMAVANGYIFDTTVVETAATDLLLVQTSEAADNLTGIRAKVMFADGRTEVIEISKLNGATVSNGNNVAGDTLYTYEKKSDNTYEVKEVTSSNLAGNDVYTTAIDDYNVATTNTAANLNDGVNNYGIADSAVIFLKSTASSPAKYSVITGADLKSYSDITITATKALIKSGNVNAIYVETSASIGASSVWAYVTSDPYRVRFNDTNMNYAKAWTVDGEIEVYTTGTVAKGGIYELTKNTDNTYTVEGTSAKEVAIVSYSESDNAIYAVQGDSTVYINDLKITDKTQVLYVDSKNNVGVAGGAIAEAGKTSADKYIPNAYAYVSGDELKAIVFDSNNEWNGGSAIGVAVTNTAPTLTPANNITIVEAKADVQNVAAGDVITYTVKYKADTAVSAASKITFTAGTNSTAIGTVVINVDAGSTIAETTVTFKAIADGNGAVGEVSVVAANR